MPLTTGSRLGQYEILSTLGSGGMGEVYRALDTRLDRQVAIKILPDAFAFDPERVTRFQHEARTLGGLNHPNIGAIHGVEEVGGITALVMELVEGDDLFVRLGRGPVPVDEALPIARQIAEALEAAHGQGVIHRDLKPANIKVRPDGRVKVLDFGLAKVLQPAGSAPGVAPPPTITSPAMTQAGIVLGTAAYMSPEQARGRPVDQRTDIWAFGCVLHEMLTGQRTFPGNEVSDVMASVLLREPDLSALPAATPQAIRRLLRRCLEKEPTERLRDIGDARIEIRDVLSKAEPQPIAIPDPEAAGWRGQRLAWTVAVTALTLALAAGATLLFRRAPVVSEMRLEISTPPTSDPGSVAISPDGRAIAFVADADGQSRLWLRSLETGAARALGGTDGARLPFWSPDSRSIGFFADDRVRRIDLDGGSVRSLADAAGGHGGTWSGDNVILFATLGRPIFRVPAGGGQAVAVPGLALEGSDFSPSFLPDGRHFLYYLRGEPDVRGVYVGGLDETLPPRRLVDAEAGAVYAPSGHLLFTRQRTLYADTFDLRHLSLAGRPVAVAEGIATDEQTVSVSDGGSIAFRSHVGGIERRLVWFDRSGRELGRFGEGLRLSQPSLSPDDRRVAFYGVLSGNPDILVLDTDRGALSRVTTDPADDVWPVWSPDGTAIMFSSNRTRVHDLYVKSLIGDQRETARLSTPLPKIATDWSRDGRFVLFNVQDPKLGVDIWALPMDGKGKPFPVVQSAFDEQNGQFSPDGHWIAYQSNKSGRPEIYVQPFPGPGTESTISTTGGTQVRWGRDGKELYYVAPKGRLMAVPIRTSANTQTPDLGQAQALFAPPLGSAVQHGDYRHQYMVTSDGSRMLVATAMEETAASPITVILNLKPRP